LAAAVLIACAMSAGLFSAPIELWDESRNAVNALEMRQTGLGLVTTYEFRPDQWNTKPPLLIWLMVASTRLLGPSLWAFRLPSVLAALGTLWCVVSFSWRLSRSRATTLLAALLVATSFGFFGQHAAATGDYDALLCLFTTAYIYLSFFALHRRRPRPVVVVGIGLLISAAVLTKGVAGVVPGAGIVLYLLVTRRIKRPFVSPWYLASALVVILSTGAFYGLREMEAPGYLSAVVRNELGGRYIQSVARLDQRPWWYYLRVLFGRASSFVAGALGLFAPFGLLWADKRLRLGLCYALCIVAGILAVYSLGWTKHPWYLVPVYPFLAVALALAVNAAVRSLGTAGFLGDRGHRLVREYGQTGGALAIIALLAARFAYSELWMYRHPFDLPFEAGYDAVFSDLHRQGIREIRVVDGGVENGEGFVHYTPQLLAYARLWQARGLTTLGISHDLGTSSALPGDVTATCDPRYANQLSRDGERLASTPGCVAVRLRGLK
jgi:4-amino-4-deoxy-L-arabinose transferase-like glycosyltransferase